MAHYRFQDIIAELQRDIPSVLSRIGVDVPPRARKGTYYLICSPLPGRVDKNPSFAIYHTGPKAGQYSDFSAAEQGDIIDLIIAMGAARDKRDARAWALDYLGWGGLGARGLSEEELAHKRETARQERVRAEAKAAKELKAKRGEAFFGWKNLSPDLRGTLAQTYIEGARGLPFHALPQLPGCLRFDPACRYTERGRDYPAVTALISGPSGAPYAVHRTYLEPDGSDKLKVTGAERARKIWPDYAGGMIRLSKGVSKLSPEKANAAVLSGDHRHCRPVILTEGWEDGLVNMMAAPDYRVWAAVSLSNLMNVPDMPCLSEFIIWQDNDWDKPQAIAAFERAVLRLRGFGKPVRIIAPKAHKDANDILLAHRANF